MSSLPNAALSAVSMRTLSLTLPFLLALELFHILHITKPGVAIKCALGKELIRALW